jgi:hypothetical protein
MLAVSGLGIIDPDPQNPINIVMTGYGTAIFSFRLICKDPYKSIRHYYICSVVVPGEFVQKAKQKLVAGKTIQVRLGELKGTKFQSGKVFASIQTKWKWIECLNLTPTADRDTYTDI